jgi:hypothetical protein
MWQQSQALNPAHHDFEADAMIHIL